MASIFPPEHKGCVLISTAALNGTVHNAKQVLKRAIVNGVPTQSLASPQVLGGSHSNTPRDVSSRVRRHQRRVSGHAVIGVGGKPMLVRSLA